MGVGNKMISFSQIPTKRIAINKANTQMVIIIGLASFVTVFCLVASRAVWSQTKYQSRVTAADQLAKNQLIANISASKNLIISYNKFVSQSTNIIGGSINGGGNNGGNNAKIILDALPSTYDFPALISSIEKILNQNNVNIASITGTDEELSEGSNNSSSSPQPVSMPFSFTIDNANYTSVQQVMTTLQDSIRPMQVDSITLSGGTDNMTLTVNAHTYYQPAKSFSIVKQVVQ